MKANGDDASVQERLDSLNTVPPPAGEDDPYSAATRVGAPPPDEVLSAMREATARGLPLKPQGLPAHTGDSSTPPAASAPFAAPATPRMEEVDLPSSELPFPTANEAVPSAAPRGRVPLSLVIALALTFLVTFVIVGQRLVR